MLALLGFLIVQISSSLFYLGPAPASVTDHIYEITTKIKEYYICPEIKLDLDILATHEYDIDGKPFVIQVIDSVDDYKSYMKEIFDFGAIKQLLTGGHMNVLVNALHGGKS